MHYGNALPVIPAGDTPTDITRSLGVIAGVQPVQHAQRVAERHTALWQPRVQDALREGFAGRSLSLRERFHLWRYTRKFQRALRRHGIHDARRTW